MPTFSLSYRHPPEAEALRDEVRTFLKRAMAQYGPRTGAPWGGFNRDFYVAWARADGSG